MTNGYELVEKLLERYFGKRGANVVICLILMMYGITHTDMQKKYGVALSTTRRYRKALESGSIDCLFSVGERVRERSKLDDFEEEILGDFEGNPPKTLREAQSRIETLTATKRSLPRISAWLLKRGFARGQ